jgi:putative glutamine amidotransferase
MTDPIPLVALPACRWEKDGQSYHTIGDKYVRAVAEAAGCLPMMLPSLSESVDLDDLVDKLDGLVLTGSPSNVHPERYGDSPSEKAEPYDEARDAVTLPLIRKAAEAGLPLLAICRGLQELNVAFGGTLYPRVHEVAGRDDHRRPPDQTRTPPARQVARHGRRDLGGLFPTIGRPNSAGCWAPTGSR